MSRVLCPNCGTWFDASVYGADAPDDATCCTHCGAILQRNRVERAVRVIERELWETLSDGRRTYLLNLNNRLGAMWRRRRG